MMDEDVVNVTRDAAGSADLVQCVICTDIKTKEDFPTKFTDDCRHPINVCIADAEKWIEFQLGWHAWGAIVCPQCSMPMTRSDIKRLVQVDLFEKYFENNQ